MPSTSRTVWRNWINTSNRINKFSSVFRVLSCVFQSLSAGFFFIFDAVKRSLLLFASLSGTFSVAFGAMGAHFLKGKISAESLQVFETAVRYQFFHTFAVIAAALLSEKINTYLPGLAANFFIAGIILFSGSLYFLSLRSLMDIDETQVRWAGAITPFGGIAFISGWLLLFFAVLKLKR